MVTHKLLPLMSTNNGVGNLPAAGVCVTVVLVKQFKCLLINLLLCFTLQCSLMSMSSHIVSTEQTRTSPVVSTGSEVSGVCQCSRSGRRLL